MFKKIKVHQIKKNFGHQNKKRAKIWTEKNFFLGKPSNFFLLQSLETKGSLRDFLLLKIWTLRLGDKGTLKKIKVWIKITIGSLKKKKTLKLCTLWETFQKNWWKLGDKAKALKKKEKNPSFDIKGSHQKKKRSKFGLEGKP